MGKKWSVDDRHQLDDRINRKLDEVLAPDESVRVIISHGTSLIATSRRVFLFKRTFQAGGLIRGDVMASWDMSDLTGVVFQQFGNWGYVALVGPGLEDPASVRLQATRKSGPHQIVSLPNVQRVQGTILPITPRIDPAGLAERVAVLRGLVSAAKAVNSGPTSGPDAVEQLRKLAGLRDEGIITAAEFEAKKSELLTRM